MKAILTSWNGVSYRSRLEARWSVVFDSLGLGAVYEAEGYEHAGQCYLPDFELAGTGQLVAIKPESDMLNDTAEWRRELEWQRDMAACGMTLIIVCGVPVPSRYQLGLYDTELPAILLDCRRCAGLCWRAVDGSWGKIGMHTCGDHDRPPIGSKRILQAMRRAMSEHFGASSQEAAR
jgi:hypothetical protein